MVEYSMIVAFLWGIPVGMYLLSLIMHIYG